MLSYKTIQGDTWDSISKKVYGYEHYWPEVKQANTKYKDVVFFTDGIELEIPAIRESVPKELPPWKR